MPTKKSAGDKRTAVGPFETADRPEKIRNVALVGHSGSGKTTLVEALLAATGTITRAGTVADGSTVSDYDPVEVAQQRSVALSVCPLRHDDIVVNLLDTPGYPDFTGELRAGLRAADAALFVVSAAEDIDPITSTLWEECAALGTPRAVVMTRLDAPRASFDDSVAACQRVFGGADGQDVLPLYLPVAHEPETAPEALVGLLSRRVYDYASGFPPKVSDLTDDVAVAGDVEQARNALIEAIINNSEDESLLDRYLPARTSAWTCSSTTWKPRLRGEPSTPSCRCARAPGWVWASCLEIISGGFPSPVELDPPAVTTVTGGPAKPIQCDPAGPLVGEVIRTSVDPYQGRLSILRIFSGTLTPDSAIHVSRTRRRVARASGPRHGRAGRPALLAVRRHAAPDRQGGRR